MAPSSRSNDGLLALVSCLSGGYKFASVLRCVGLVTFVTMEEVKLAMTKTHVIESQGIGESAGFHRNSLNRFPTNVWNGF